MGTNYYLHEKPKCECCGRTDEPLHIGKSSAGWHFSLHVMPEEDIACLDDWVERWSRPGAYIVNEYGEVVSGDDMLREITQRGKPGMAPKWSAEDYNRNHAEPGKNGLVRHRVDGGHCVGHGDGTYDYMTGWFS